MLVNLDELSANDLLELAKKKQQQEEENSRRAALVGRLAQLRKRREQLLSDQERALAILDKELQSLQQRRLQLAASHQTALSALDKEMAELSASTNDAPVAERPAASGIAAPTHPTAAPSPAHESGAGKSVAEERAPVPVSPKTPATTASVEAPTPASGPVIMPTAEDLEIAIVQMLRGRMDMSDSLMREQLRNKGFDVSKVGRILDQLVREGKIMSKGSGNYALKKRL